MPLFQCVVKSDTRQVNLFTDEGKVTRAGAGAKELAGDRFPFRGHENGCRAYMGTFCAKEEGSCAFPSPFRVSVNRSGQRPAVVEEEEIGSCAEAASCWVMLRNITGLTPFYCWLYLFRWCSLELPIKAIDGIISSNTPKAA